MFVEPQIGDLFLCYDGTLLDKAIDEVEEIGMIRRGQKPPRGRPIYSHVAVYIGNGMCIEALGPGLTLTDAATHHGKADVYGADMSHKRRDAIVRKAIHMYEQGYRYSVWDIFVQFMWLLFSLRIPWRQKHSLVCSVFGHDVWQAAGVQIAPRQNCAPEEIALFGALEYRGRF